MSHVILDPKEVPARRFNSAPPGRPLSQHTQDILIGNAIFVPEGETAQLTHATFIHRDLSLHQRVGTRLGVPGTYYWCEPRKKTAKRK